MKKIAGYYSEIEEYDGFYFRYNYKRQELEALDENKHVLTYKELSLEDWEDNNEYWIETFADELSEEAGRWTDSLLEEFGCLEKKKVKKAEIEKKAYSETVFKNKLNEYIKNLDNASKGLKSQILLKNLSDTFIKEYEEENDGEQLKDTLNNASEQLNEISVKLGNILEDLNFWMRDMGFRE